MSKFHKILVKLRCKPVYLSAGSREQMPVIEIFVTVIVEGVAHGLVCWQEVIRDAYISFRESPKVN